MSTSPQKAAEHVDIRSYDHTTPQGRIDQTNIRGVKNIYRRIRNESAISHMDSHCIPHDIAAFLRGRRSHRIFRSRHWSIIYHDILQPSVMVRPDLTMPRLLLTIAFSASTSWRTLAKRGVWIFFGRYWNSGTGRSNLGIFICGGQYIQKIECFWPSNSELYWAAAN